MTYFEQKAVIEALQWYADTKNWRRRKGRKEFGPKSWQKSSAQVDKGARARFILESCSTKVTR